MFLMACVLISRLSSHTSRLLVSGFSSLSSARQLSTSVPVFSAPNVVIYSSDNEEKSLKIKSLLGRIFSTDSLAVYPLTRENLLKADAPWINNVRGLVLDDCDRLSREEVAGLLAFFKKGGHVLDLGSNFCKHIGIGRGDTVVNLESGRPILQVGKNGVIVRSKGVFSPKTKPQNEELELKTALNSQDGKSLAVEVFHKSSSGKALLSRVPFHLSAEDLGLSKENTELYNKQTQDRDGVALDLFKRLEFVSSDYSFVKSDKPKQSVKENSIFVFGNFAPKVLDALKTIDKFKSAVNGEKVDAKDCRFSANSYFSALKTRQLGNTLLYQPVCDTTMNLVQSARSGTEAKNVGIVAVCDRQTSGLGRAGNKWLSPDGCAMFTFHLAVNAGSELGRRLPIVQSIAALSCVTSIIEHSKKPVDLDIKIKWPNDIYFDGKTKIGGILVKSTVIGSLMHCSVGIGINLSNKEPTLCLDKIFASKNVSLMSREVLFASILNNFEKHIDAVNAFKVNEFIDEYCDNWLHNDQRVTVREECVTDYCTVPIRRNPPPANPHAVPPSTLKSGNVRRIDEYGYLVVQFQDRSLATLHPDGNSFDAMNGLILPKFANNNNDENAASSSSGGRSGNLPKLGDRDYPRTKHVRGMVSQVR